MDAMRGNTSTATSRLKIRKELAAYCVEHIHNPLMLNLLQAEQDLVFPVWAGFREFPSNENDEALLLGDPDVGTVVTVPVLPIEDDRPLEADNRHRRLGAHM